MKEDTVAEVKCDKCGQSVAKVCEKCQQPKVAGTVKILLIATVILGVVTFLAMIPLLFIYDMPGDANNFGDSFGFANALVSACAFAALVMTMFWQKQELEQQRHEIRQMREANEKSADAQRDSHEALERATRYAALETLRQSADEMAREGTGALKTQVLRGMMLRNVIENTLADTLKNDKYLKLDISYSDEAVGLVAQTLHLLFYYKEEEEYSRLNNDRNDFKVSRLELVQQIHTMLRRTRSELKTKKIIATNHDQTMKQEEERYAEVLRKLEKDPNDLSAYDDIDALQSIDKLWSAATLVVKKSRLSKALGEFTPFHWEAGQK